MSGPTWTLREVLQEHPDRRPDEDLVHFAKRLGFGPEAKLAEVLELDARTVGEAFEAALAGSDGKVVH